MRWLQDSVKYNEWMNPIDYEVEETQTETNFAGAVATFISRCLFGRQLAGYAAV